MAKLTIKNKYGIVPHEVLNYKELSFKAKGIYGYLQSKPDNWSFTIGGIASQSKESKDAIRSGLQELEEVGLLERSQVKNAQGRWENEYQLSDKPHTENPHTDKPHTENPYTKKERESKKDIVKIDKDIVDEDFAISSSDINAVITAFKRSLNPAINYANTTYRDSAKHLLSLYSMDKILKTIEYIEKIRGDRFAPVITNPYQLRDKFGALIQYSERQKNEVSSIGITI